MTVTDGRRRIISDPPLIVPPGELAGHLDVGAVCWFPRRLIGTLVPVTAGLSPHGPAIPALP
jgi:hypothetical protein